MKWYEATELQIQSDSGMMRDRYLAYHNTFLKDAQGRQVLHDIERSVALYLQSESLSNEQALAFLVLGNLIEAIKVRCGLPMGLKRLEAEVKASTYPVSDTPQQKTAKELTEP